MKAHGKIAKCKMQKDAESGPFDRASVRKSLPEKEFHHRFAISYRLEKKRAKGNSSPQE